MDYFAQQLINGIVLGSIYGLIAIGYTMVYGIVGMINFAHGDIFMIGGFIALISFLILVSIGLTAVPVILLIVLLVSMAITALYGWTVERIAYRPLRHSFRLAPMLSAIGMSFVLSNYSQVAQGARVKPVPPIIPGGSTRRLPDMPRCRMRWPSPQSTSRYLPRRSTPRTLRPASRRTAFGTGQRSRRCLTSTPEITRPARCGARPRRVTSTSGSSGMTASLVRGTKYT